MRDLIITIFILGAVPFSFRRPFLGLLVFSLLAYMRLQDLAWGFAAVQRWSLLITVVSLLGYVADRYRAYPVLNMRTLLLIGMVLQVGVGLFFAVGDAPVDYDGYVEYVKIIFIALFTTAVVRTQSQLRILVWVIALSMGFHGAKNGVAAVIKMGNLFIDHGPGGLIRDNNDFALAIAMTVPWIYYLAKSEKNPVLTKVMYAIVPLCGLTVISTRSRGGTLSLALAALIIIWRSRNRVMGLIVGISAVALVTVIAPSEYKERLSTIQSYDKDGSAMGRLRAWGVAMRMIDAHPVFGVGFNRFALNHLDFQPNPTEGERAGGKALVAHNSYFQIWAESGTPAFAMYMALIFATFWDIWRVRWRAKRLYVDSWILSY
ncbi:MAG TPA: putative O-glycosylation ligase, exosortase A system-associated, partial [Planctomycetota bacterium]|nr:putative O-glycosylation ligase, exosortase A system-associated [Planctomycetota bacterium]